MAHAQFTLDVRTGPVTQTPGEFDILPQKGSKGVVVQVPGKAALVRGILAGSTSEDAGNSTEASVPFTMAELKAKVTYNLRQLCFKYKLAKGKISDCKWTKKECLEALKKKFGLEGSVLSDQQQKAEESSNALTTFLKSEDAVAITSKIPGFDPKNTDDAESFMAQYRKKHGEGPTRSRNINLNVTRTSRRVDAVLGASARVVRRGRREGLRPGRRDAVDAVARFL